MEWMLLPLKRYAQFDGRSRRMEYWMFFLFTFVVSIVLQILDAMLGLGFLYLVFALGVLVPSIAVGIRRMHDTDHSGWWILVPIVNLVFAFTPGTAGPNRFGDDPKGGVSADTFS